MDKVSEKMFDQLWRLHDLNDENPKFIICGEAADWIKTLSDRIEKLEAERDTANKCIRDAETYLDLGSAKFAYKVIKKYLSETGGTANAQ